MVKLIVARDQRALYEYLRWGLAGVPHVEVILDRRHWTRRARDGNAAVAAEERRGPDRRRRAGVRAELLARGFVIAR